MGFAAEWERKVGLGLVGVREERGTTPQQLPSEMSEAAFLSSFDFVDCSSERL